MDDLDGCLAFECDQHFEEGTEKMKRCEEQCYEIYGEDAEDADWF